MAASGLTPEHEEQLTAELLRERAGIDPGRVGPVVDLAAIGLVNGACRNTCVERWHAAGRLEDGDLLRASSHATWRVRQLMRRWMREAGLDAGSPASALDEVTAEGTWQLAGRLYQWLPSPLRKLPTGVTLGQLAGDDLAEYKDDADAGFSTFAVQAEDRGGADEPEQAADHPAGPLVEVALNRFETRFPEVTANTSSSLCCIVRRR
jgi:hypothetical protein